MKELLDELSGRYPQLREYLLIALKDSSRYGLWEKGGAR